MAAIDPGRFTTLTFDIVGTVIDFETGLLRWFRDHLRGEGKSLDDATILAAVAEAEDRLQRARPDLSYTAMLGRIYKEVAQEWGLKAGDEAAAELRGSIPRWPPFADSPDAMRRLGQRYTLVAITNADQWGARCMDAAAGGVFDVLATCDEAGVNKPDARAFAHGLRKAGAARGEVLHVAQSQYHDIAGARAYGLPVVWVERRAGTGSTGATPPVGQQASPDLHVTSLAELADALGC